MAIKLHRCPNQWAKLGAHPCWKVEKALQEQGIEYEVVPGPLRRSKRDALEKATGQRKYPAIQFEDGSWYREESNEMARTIRGGSLMSRAGGADAPASG